MANRTGLNYADPDRRTDDAVMRAAGFMGAGGNARADGCYRADAFPDGTIMAGGAGGTWDALIVRPVGGSGPGAPGCHPFPGVYASAAALVRALRDAGYLGDGR